MEAVVLVIHLLLALAIIGLVLLQRSEGGGLGIGRSGGVGGLASPRGTANALTRATAYCAAAFFCTSLILGVMAGGHSKERKGILESLPVPAAESVAVPAQEQKIEVQEDGSVAPPPSAPLAE